MYFIYYVFHGLTLWTGYVSKNKTKQNIYSVYTCEAREEAANRLYEFTATGRSNITSA